MSVWAELRKSLAAVVDQDLGEMTPNETWTMAFKPGHPYEAACQWAITTLMAEPRVSVLVLGSPPAEAEALRAVGWDVTYADWRTPPRIVGVVVRAHVNAMALPFPDESFDALSSTCVLCHVGLGRYNDPMVEAGDAPMLAECRRVVKSGSLVALMPGPVWDGPVPVVQGITQRVTTVAEFQMLALGVGFEVQGVRVFRPTLFRWLVPSEPMTDDPRKPDYLCASLRAI